MSEIIKTNTEYSNRQQAVDDCIFMIPDDYKSSMPTIEEIEQELKD